LWFAYMNNVRDFQKLESIVFKYAGMQELNLGITVTSKCFDVRYKEFKTLKTLNEICHANGAKTSLHLSQYTIGHYLCSNGNKNIPPKQLVTLANSADVVVLNHGLNNAMYVLNWDKIDKLANYTKDGLIHLIDPGADFSPDLIRNVSNQGVMIEPSFHNQNVPVQKTDDLVAAKMKDAYITGLRTAAKYGTDRKFVICGYIGPDNIGEVLDTAESEMSPEINSYGVCIHKSILTSGTSPRRPVDLNRFESTIARTQEWKQNQIETIAK